VYRNARRSCPAMPRVSAAATTAQMRSFAITTSAVYLSERTGLSASTTPYQVCKAGRGAALTPSPAFVTVKSGISCRSSNLGAGRLG
jgi:hypothetical protein